MLKFSVRRTASSRPSSPSNIENNFVEYPESNIGIGNITIHGMSSSLQQLKLTDVDSKTTTEIIEGRLVMSECDSVLDNLALPKYNRQLSDPTYDRSDKWDTISLNDEKPRRNSACSMKSKICRDSTKLTYFKEKNKLHPFLQKNCVPLKKTVFEKIPAKHDTRKRSKERQLQNDKNSEAGRLMTDKRGLQKKPGCKEQFSSNEELEGMKNDHCCVDSRLTKERKLGTVDSPNLYALQSNLIPTENGERGQSDRKLSVNTRPVHRYSTGRISLRRELLRRRITIAQFNLQMQSQFARKESRLQKLLRRIGKKPPVI